MEEEKQNESGLEASVEKENLVIERQGVLKCLYTEYGPGDFYIEYEDGTRRNIAVSISDTLFQAGYNQGDIITDRLEVKRKQA